MLVDTQLKNRGASPMMIIDYQGGPSK